MKRVQARLYVGIEDGCRLDRANSETIVANLQAAGEMELTLENDACAPGPTVEIGRPAIETNDQLGHFACQLHVLP